MRAIITRGLYLFYLIFHCGLYSRAVYIAERLILQGNFSEPFVLQFFMYCIAKKIGAIQNFFSCFTANLQIFTLFYFGVVYFTIEFERKKKKEGSNYGQIFPKIVHQKIIIVFEMQYSFCQTLNAIQTNIKESKAFKRINLRLR